MNYRTVQVIIKIIAIIADIVISSKTKKGGKKK